MIIGPNEDDNSLCKKIKKNFTFKKSTKKKC